MSDDKKALAGNVCRYPWYLFFRDCYFWGPAFFLYFTSVLTLPQALWLEAIYYVSMAALEVPSGYLSDRFGRRLTLMISSACMALAYLAFWAGNGFLVFVLAQVLMAAGFAAASGTDTALHYESLACLSRQDEYAEKEGRALKYSFRAGALGALAGGLMAIGHLKWVYAASFAAALVSFFIALGFKDTVSGAPGTKMDFTPLGRQVAGVFFRAFSRRLRFFTFYVLFMIILMHFPYEFYQSYLAEVTDGLGMAGRVTPGMTGVHLALTMLLGSLFTGVACRVRRRCQIRQVLLGAALFQVLLVGIMAAVVHPLVAGILVCRTLSRAVYTPLVNAEVSPQLDISERSTYLSLQSLMGRLCYGLVLLVLPLVNIFIGGGFRVTLAAAAVLGVVLWLILYFLHFPSGGVQECLGDHGETSHRHFHR